MPKLLEIELTPKIWKDADRRTDKLPIFKNSHRGRDANLVGCLGEILVEMWLDAEGVGYTAELKKTTHDYRLADGSTFDVKTKDRTVIPKQNYDCTRPSYNASHQNPDYYVFASLYRNRNHEADNVTRFRKAFILGAIKKNEFDKVGKDWKKGQVDPSNGTKFWTACRNVYISQLECYEDIADQWEAL